MKKTLKNSNLRKIALTSLELREAPSSVFDGDPWTQMDYFCMGGETSDANGAMATPMDSCYLTGNGDQSANSNYPVAALAGSAQLFHAANGHAPGTVTWITIEGEEYWNVATNVGTYLPATQVRNGRVTLQLDLESPPEFMATSFTATVCEDLSGFGGGNCGNCF